MTQVRSNWEKALAARKGALAACGVGSQLLGRTYRCQISFGSGGALVGSSFEVG